MTDTPRKTTSSLPLSFSTNTRKDFIEELRDDAYDILIIGGGITGAGVLRDATLRGFKTALIEKNDFASGTSSKSSKLIHGGIRYLKNLEFKLVHEALMERKTLINIAPHLVHPTQCLLPVYKHAPVPAWMIRIGLLLYDGLSSSNRIGFHKVIPTDENQSMEPALKKDDLEKLFLYYDGRADDSRLVMATVQSAVQQGAMAVNYAQAVDVVTVDNRIQGIRALDRLTGKEFTIHAKVIANATGPWCDRLRKNILGENKRRIRTTKGIHIILPLDDLPVKHTLVLTSPIDDRLVFAIPWRKWVILGTTDTDYNDDPDWIPIKEVEVDYLLQTFQEYFPDTKLTSEKILSAFAGLRPLRFEEGISADDVSREYQIFESPSRFFTIIGGKLTTYRTMAKELTDRMARTLEAEYGILPPQPECITHKHPLYGGDTGDYWQFCHRWYQRLSGEMALDEDVAHNLIESYGSRLPDVLNYLKKDRNNTRRIIPELPYLWGEVDYTCAHEMAVGLDDILMRRTHIFSLDPDNGLSVMEPVARHLQYLLKWTDKFRSEQTDLYRKRVQAMREFKN